MLKTISSHPRPCAFPTLTKDSGTDPMAQTQSALVQSRPEEAAEPASVTAEVFTVGQAAEGMRKQAMGN